MQYNLITIKKGMIGINEVWKDIQGYEGLYKISNLGNVKSLNYKRTNISRNLIINKISRGYSGVRLCKDKIHRSHQVHRLVAQAFIPNPNNLPQINHKNEVKSDNRVENLEWCTARYNLNYGTANERRGISNSIKVIGTHVVTGEVIKLNALSNGVEYGFDHSNISKCCLGKRKTHKGYTWRYDE